MIFSQTSDLVCCNILDILGARRFLFSRYCNWLYNKVCVYGSSIRAPNCISLASQEAVLFVFPGHEAVL